MESISSNKRIRVDSDEFESNSIKAKRIRDDLLDDSDVCTASSDLDSFIKSFEDEISKLPESVADCDSVSGESPPDLGFLFEASDDELGLPPTDLTPVESEKMRDSVEIGEVWGLDEYQICSYDHSFEYGFGYAGGDGDNPVISSYSDGEYVVLDGLFDVGFGLSGVPPESDPLCRLSE